MYARTGTAHPSSFITISSSSASIFLSFFLSILATSPLTREQRVGCRPRQPGDTPLEYAVQVIELLLLVLLLPVRLHLLFLLGFRHCLIWHLGRNTDHQMMLSRRFARGSSAVLATRDAAFVSST